MTSHSRSSSLPSDGSGESLLRRTSPHQGDFHNNQQHHSNSTGQLPPAINNELINKSAGRGFVSLGGVRYGVRLAAGAKYSAGRAAAVWRGAANCCGHSSVDCCQACPSAPLDRLQRFRFGGRSTSGERKPRSDRTERLKELTDRLRGRPPPPPPPPPLPPPRLHRQQRSASTEAPNNHNNYQYSNESVDSFEYIPLKAEAKTVVGSYARRIIPFRSASFSQADYDENKYVRGPHRDFFGIKKNSVVSDINKNANGKTTNISAHPMPPNSQSRIPTVIPDHSREHYSARSLTHPLPTRCASADGSCEPYTKKEPENRKSLQYLPVSNSPILEEPLSSPTDSVITRIENPSPIDASLDSAYPFEFPIIDDIISSGLNATDIVPIDVTDESDLRATVDEPTQYSKANIFIETPEGKVLKTATASTIPVPVYECIVREWTNLPSEGWLEVKANESETKTVSLPKVEENGKVPSEDKHISDQPDDETITSEQVENLLATVQNTNKPPPLSSDERKRTLDKSKRRKGIYITKWPIRDEVTGMILPESVIGAQFKDDAESTVIPNGDIINLETGDFEVFLGSNCNTNSTSSDSPVQIEEKRSNDPSKWISQNSACIWNAPQCESLSPDTDDKSTPIWPKNSTESRWNSRPTLTYQSSEEKDDIKTSKILKKPTVLARTDSLSEGESECGGLSTPIRDRTASPSPFNPSDFSDTDTKSRSFEDRSSHHTPRRYSKRPLRGPYGQMLEAEMKKPELAKLSKHDEELKFLDELVSTLPGRPTSPNVSSSRTSLLSTTSSAGQVEPRITITRSRGGGNHSFDDTQLKSSYGLSGSPVQKSVIRSSPKRKVSANIPYSAPDAVLSPSDAVNRGLVFHQRTTSSPSKLEGFSSRISGEQKKKQLEPSAELLADLLRGSSERLSTDTSLDGIPFNVQRHNDTRTHVVVELYDTERSYVEALQILVTKYLNPLKSPENVGLIDASVVDEIFFQVPEILALHEVFLEELRRRLETWDIKQKVGDIFINSFSKTSVMDTYTLFINNWKKAKETIKSTSASRPAFARFLEAMAREHKGKLSLDNLLIKPVQKFPRYELLIQRLIKHTEPTHPDHSLLIDAQKEIHELLVRINCTERETLEQEQQQQTLRELESLVEGLANLVATDRMFIRHDTVSMPAGQGGTKERALFLFSDLLLITSMKRRTGTIRKPSAVSCQSSIASILEANKYKLLMRVPLDDMEILKAKDENLRRIMREMETLSEDVNTLNQINELMSSLHCNRTQLEDVVKDMLTSLGRQLADRQGSDSQLSCMEVAINTSSGIQNLTFIFNKADKRSNWEEIFNEAKQKLALSDEKRPTPEFVASVPIRKTRAGLQFTCAAPTLATGQHSTRDVWVCNSDGYVGQVCVLTLHPEPQVTSCNGVCNARILCVACIPPPVQNKNSTSTENEPLALGTNKPNNNTSKSDISISVQNAEENSANIRLESSSSSEDDDDGSSAGETVNEKKENSSLENQLPKNSTTKLSSGNNQNKQFSSGSNNGQNNTNNQVMKSNSNPNVDKTSMGILSGSVHKQSIEENNSNQPTMWLGTEDGCIHVYNCTDNIRIKKNKVKIQHGSGVFCIVYIDNKVFVSLANGDLIVYIRDNGSWTEHASLTIGTVSAPVSKLLLSGGKLWCAQHTNIKIVDPCSIKIEDSFSVSTDSQKSISHIAISGQAIWVTLHNTAILKCYHANSKEILAELNIAPAVTKMLAGCDDIIRQHKAACLRVTSLLACRELLWVGTSAGVLLTAPAAPLRPPATPSLCGIPQGHTGHVRFLTAVEATPIAGISSNLSAQSSVTKRQSIVRKSITNKTSDQSSHGNLLIISGGDGYEDFRNSGVSEVAGREDSTNHLLLWKV